MDVHSSTTHNGQKAETTQMSTTCGLETKPGIFRVEHCCCLVAKSRPTPLRPHRLWPASLLCPWASPGKNTRCSSWPFPSPGDLPDPGAKPTSPALAGGFLLLSHHKSANGILFGHEKKDEAFLHAPTRKDFQNTILSERRQ